MDTLAEGLRWLLAFPLVSYLWYQFAAISYIIRTCIPSLHFILLPVYVSGEPPPLNYLWALFSSIFTGRKFLSTFVGGVVGRSFLASHFFHRSSYSDLFYHTT